MSAKRQKRLRKAFLLPKRTRRVLLACDVVVSGSVRSKRSPARRRRRDARFAVDGEQRNRETARAAGGNRRRVFPERRGGSREPPPLSWASSPRLRRATRLVAAYDDEVEPDLNPGFLPSSAARSKRSKTPRTLRDSRRSRRTPRLPCVSKSRRWPATAAARRRRAAAGGGDPKRGAAAKRQTRRAPRRNRQSRGGGAVRKRGVRGGHQPQTRARGVLRGGRHAPVYERLF